jgi:hypothetical protein
LHIQYPKQQQILLLLLLQCDFEQYIHLLQGYFALLGLLLLLEPLFLNLELLLLFLLQKLLQIVWISRIKELQGLIPDLYYLQLIIHIID